MYGIVFVILETNEKQGNRWNAPQMLLFIKGRSCNQTPLEHQEMTKKNIFYEKEQGEITQVKCKI